MQIINANLDLVSRSVEPAADKEALEENKRIVRQLDLAASLRTWLALQGHVNSLLDSSTATQADVSVSALPPRTCPAGAVRLMMPPVANSAPIWIAPVDSVVQSTAPCVLRNNLRCDVHCVPPPPGCRLARYPCAHDE